MATLVSRAFYRHFSKTATNQTLPSVAARAGGHGDSADLWKKIFFFVGVPAIGLGMINAYIGHQKDHHKPRPEFVPYEYMRIRTKRFPWGDGNHSLFHNPKVNALPDGYETEDDHH